MAIKRITTAMFLLAAVLTFGGTGQADETLKTVQAQIGQKVQVDVSGLQTGGISAGTGVAATGTIVDVNNLLRQITVQLDVSFGGINRVTVPPERVRVIQ